MESIDTRLKEYKEAKEEPDFDGKKSERLVELQVKILDYLFKNSAVEVELEFEIDEPRTPKPD